jgi:hypothetical protein
MHLINWLAHSVCSTPYPSPLPLRGEGGVRGEQMRGVIMAHASKIASAWM